MASMTAAAIGTWGRRRRRCAWMKLPAPGAAELDGERRPWLRWGRSRGGGGGEGEDVDDVEGRAYFRQAFLPQHVKQAGKSRPRVISDFGRM